MLFSIQHGQSANLSTAPKVAGCWYVTDDTHELYYCPDGNELVCMNKMEPFDPSEINTKLEQLNSDVTSLKSHKLLDTRLDLPASGNENIVYYIESEQASYMWSDLQNRFYRVGTDYNAIESISGGTAEVITKNNKSI